MTLKKGISVCLFVESENVAEEIKRLSQSLQEVLEGTETQMLPVFIDKGEKLKQPRFFVRLYNAIRVPALVTFGPSAKHQNPRRPNPCNLQLQWKYLFVRLIFLQVGARFVVRDRTALSRGTGSFVKQKDVSKAPFIHHQSSYLTHYSKRPTKMLMSSSWARIPIMAPDKPTG